MKLLRIDLIPSALPESPVIIGDALYHNTLVILALRGLAGLRHFNNSRWRLRRTSDQIHSLTGTNSHVVNW